MKPRHLGAVLALAGISGAAQAGIVFYTDRATWEAAVGPASFSENFSGFGVDTQFRTAPLALNGMTIGQEGANSFRNEVEVAPFAFADNNATPHASSFTDFGATTVRITFDALNHAYGGESWDAASGERARLEVYNGATLIGSQDLGAGNGTFLGYEL